MDMVFQYIIFENMKIMVNHLVVHFHYMAGIKMQHSFPEADGL